MWYTYVLLCSDQTLYVGSTGDLKTRFKYHVKGKVETTKKRLPVRLVYYEACLDKKRAQDRERYFKTGYGRQFLKKRLGL